MPIMGHMYDNVEECYADRHKWRTLWFHAICARNLLPGPTVAENLLKEYDIYTGMRSRTEFEKTRHLFDHILWVDRSKHVPLEAAGSMELNSRDASWFIDNNGTLDDLKVTVASFMDFADGGK